MVLKKKILAGLLGLAIIAPISAQAYSGVQDSYITGKNRYETAGLIADKQKYTTAILVNSDSSLSDGLSASGLAGALNCPILLVKKDSIPTDTMNRLKGVDKIYIIGGNNAISKNIEDTLKNKKMIVERIQGKDRIETSYNVAKKINSFNKTDKIFLVNGYKGEADAMSVAPISARDKSPIILTNGNKVSFDASKINSYVIGQSSAMSQEIVDKTKSNRIGGANRFETNKKVIEYFYKNPTEFFLTKGYSLVDSLTVSPIAKDKPVVLVHNNSDKSILKNAVKFTAIGGIDKNTLQQAINAMTASNPSGNTSLSKDWKDNQIQINGKVLKLPIKLKDLNNLGYTLSKKDPFIINPGKSVTGTSLKNKAGNYITGVYSNLSDKPIDIKDSWLTVVNIPFNNSNKTIDVVFPGNLKFGATIDNVKSVYGNPSKVSGDKGFSKLTYTVSIHKYLELTFTNSKLSGYYLSDR